MNGLGGQWLRSRSALLLRVTGELGHDAKASFASLKNQTETLFRLICCERKILFRLKKQAENMDYKRANMAFEPNSLLAVHHCAVAVPGVLVVWLI